jgi:hypothetical protein
MVFVAAAVGCYCSVLMSDLATVKATQRHCNSLVPMQRRTHRDVIAGSKSDGQGGLERHGSVKMTRVYPVYHILHVPRCHVHMTDDKSAKCKWRGTQHSISSVALREHLTDKVCSERNGQLVWTRTCVYACSASCPSVLLDQHGRSI